MLSKEEKREAARKFRERKSPIGVYAVRCTTTGAVWVGASRNLLASRNGIWAGLKMGAHRDTSLQQAWIAEGEPAFTYEALEELEEDVSPLLVADLLKNRKQHWITQLRAQSLL